MGMVNHAPTRNTDNEVRSRQTPSPLHPTPVRARRAVPQPLPAGAHFVTICTRERECLFGHVVNGEMRLNDAGEIARRCWADIPVHFPLVELDAFVIMPNHVHGIIVIQGRGEESAVPQTTCAIKTKSRRGEKSFAPTSTAPTTTIAQSPSRTIGSIVRGFKIGVTKWFRANTDLHSIWPRNYYEHVETSRGQV